MTTRLEPAEENARRCAEMINRYWATKGVVANAMLSPVFEDNGKITWEIQSNLINGMPPNAEKWKEYIK